MIKLIAIIMVLSSTTYIGFFYAKRFRDRPIQLKQLQLSLQMLETEIVYNSIPLFEAFNIIASRLPNTIGKFYTIASNYLQQEDYTVHFAIKKSLEELEHELALKETDRDLLLNLSTILGNSDRNDQTKHLQLINKSLDLLINEAKNEQEKNEKMVKQLGFLLGLLIVILII